MPLGTEIHSLTWNKGRRFYGERIWEIARRGLKGFGEGLEIRASDKALRRVAFESETSRQMDFVDGIT